MCFILLPDCNLPSTKFHKYLFTGSQVIMCRKVDGQKQTAKSYWIHFFKYLIVNSLKEKKKKHHKLNKTKSAEYPQILRTVFVWCRHSPVSGFRIYCGSNFHASVATILRASSTNATSESDMKNGKLMRAKPGRNISKLECSSLRRRCVRSKRLNTNSRTQCSYQNTQQKWSACLQENPSALKESLDILEAWKAPSTKTEQLYLQHKYTNKLKTLYFTKTRVKDKLKGICKGVPNNKGTPTLMLRTSLWLQCIYGTWEAELWSGQQVPMLRSALQHSTLPIKFTKLSLNFPYSLCKHSVILLFNS
jgi:hypothetical protein